MCRSALEITKIGRLERYLQAIERRDRQRRRRRFLENAEELGRLLVADFFRCVSN
jgi:hypothetical protein